MKALNQERTLYASAARTATPSGDAVAIIPNQSHVAAHFIIVTSSVTGASVVPTVQGLDSAGNAYDVLVGTAITTTGTVVLKVGPGIGIINNGAVADYLPLRFQLLMTHGNGSSITYSARVQMFSASN